MRWNPDRGGSPDKVLLVQLRRIGDAVLVTPVLDALREAWPGARLHLLTSGPIPDLFVGDERLAAVWIRPSSRARLGELVRTLRRERFDLVLDFQSLPWTALLSRVTGAYGVGFARRGRGWLYRRAVRLEAHRGTDYAADHKLDLVRALGLSPRLHLPRLTPPEGSHAAWEGLPPGPRVVLCPVSRRAHKRWTPDAFAETARLVNERTGAGFLLVGGPGERSVLEQVASLLEEVPFAVQETKRLRELVSLLAGADLFFGNDNGPRHVAVALGVPTLAYFGTQNPTHWTPPGGDPHRVVWNRERARGRPVREDLVVVSEDPRAVAAAAAELLQRRGTRSR